MKANTTTAGPSQATLTFKRALDICASVCGLIVLAPVFAAIALAIKLDSRGPVFFRQERVGRGWKIFRIFKFRSMVTSAPECGTAITVAKDARITRVGGFLRRKKLDELPQLLNVLRGEMSLVGPRPEVPEFMKLYAPSEQEVILSLRPGLTDYASILFRDENSMLDGHRDPIRVYCDEIMPIKFLHYARYAREIGFITDLRVIVATIAIVLFDRSPRFLRISS